LSTFRSDLDRLFREELDNWAIIQKTEDGWDIIHEKLQQTLKLRNNGRAGTITVVPSGSKNYTLGTTVTTRSLA
jgi:hypothetical protein